MQEAYAYITGIWIAGRIYSCVGLKRCIQPVRSNFLRFLHFIFGIESTVDLLLSKKLWCEHLSSFALANLSHVLLYYRIISSLHTCTHSERPIKCIGISSQVSTNVALGYTWWILLPVRAFKNPAPHRSHRPTLGSTVNIYAVFFDSGSLPGAYVTSSCLRGCVRAHHVISVVCG